MRMKEIYRPILFVVCFALMFAACGPNPNSPAAQFRTPVLETVMKGRDIIPQDPQGNFWILPTSGQWLRLRVWADSNLKVSVDGVDLKRPNIAPESEGWFEPTAYTFNGGTRNFFWDIAVKLPDNIPVDSCGVNLTLQYENVSQGTQNPTLVVPFLAGQHFSHCALSPKLASNVFDDGGENSKPGGMARSQIVSRGFVLAGWLYEENPQMPQRNNGTGLPSNETEDFHYDLWLDDDFLARNYGGLTNLKPSATLSQIPANGGTAMPLLDPNTQRLNASSLTLPGSELLTVELNAWHTAFFRRAAKPNGWMDDPDPQFSGNAWPFHPTRPLGISGSDPDLKPGDYVIVSGTLWQDTAHLSMNDPDKPNRACFDTKFKGHAGWIEIHPVDSVRKVEPPAVRVDVNGAPTYFYRKHPFTRSICSPNANQLDQYIAPPQSPPDANAILKYEVQMDSRFTSAAATHSEVIDPQCPDRLHVQASVPAGGTFKATYLLWWEPGTQPRGACNIIFLPAIPQTLGPVFED